MSLRAELRSTRRAILFAFLGTLLGPSPFLRRASEPTSSVEGMDLEWLFRWCSRIGSSGLPAAA